MRIRIPELLEIYSRLRRQQELARLPTMGLVRFLSSATLLDLADEAGEDVREIISRSQECPVWARRCAGFWLRLHPNDPCHKMTLSMSPVYTHVLVGALAWRGLCG